MNIFLLIATLASTFAGALSTLGALVLIIAGSPNSSDAQLASLKRWAIGWIVLGLCSIVGAIWAIQSRRMLLGAGIGGFPCLAALACLIYIQNTKG
jgi:hypothetical protein